MRNEAIPFDTSGWSRAEAYAHFSRVENPIYSVCFNIDVTGLKLYTKQKGLSFYYGMTKLVTDAMNEVQAFRLTLRDGKIYELPYRLPSFTDIRKGEECFYIVTMHENYPFEEFCRAAKEQSAAQTCFLDTSSETDALVYVSCTPTLELTGLTNERDPNPDDCIPRVAWGKYFLRDGRLIMGLALEVNHRFIDGYHIGEFARRLTDKIQALEIASTL